MQHDIYAKWLHDRNDSMLNYSNTERFCQYPIDTSGELCPESPQEALYLSYVYLGRYQPEKAWKTLAACTERFGAMKGTVEAFTWLHWIVEALPYRFPGENFNPTMESPPYIACKLQALSLCVKIL